MQLLSWETLTQNLEQTTTAQRNVLENSVAEPETEEVKE